MLETQNPSFNAQWCLYSVYYYNLTDMNSTVIQ